MLIPNVRKPLKIVNDNLYVTYKELAELVYHRDELSYTAIILINDDTITATFADGMTLLIAIKKTQSTTDSSRMTIDDNIYSLAKQWKIKINGEILLNVSYAVLQNIVHIRIILKEKQNEFCTTNSRQLTWNAPWLETSCLTKNHCD